MKTHELKIKEHWYKRLVDGSKTFEIRKHDRDFQPGDRLAFMVELEGDLSQLPRFKQGTDVFEITHILPASVFPEGLIAGYSIFSLKKT